MGNHPPRATATLTGLTSPSARVMSPINEAGRTSRTFSFHSKRSSGNQKTTSIYNEILRDAEKLRVMDQKNNYNHHRRVESIASNLPNQLESYSNAIFIVNEFWLNHIEQLSEEELNELVMVLWAHLFLKFKARRDILISAQKGSIGSHALKMLKVFGYVIRNLVHPSNHLKLFKQLQALGTAHRGFTLSSEIYDAMLDSFNFAMEERFKNDYKVRTRFCFSQMYQVIVDIMIGEDFYSYTMSRLTGAAGSVSMLPLTDHKSKSKTPSGHDTPSDDLNEEEMNALHHKSLSSDSTSALQTLYHQIDGFLGSLEECLSDEIGCLYFKKYLEEQFCCENFLFHEAVLKYKSAKHKHRIRMGQQIINEFVEIGAEKEVNLSYNTRKQILSIVKLVEKLNQNKDKYQQLLSVKQSQQHRAIPSIMSPDDIAFMKHETPSNGHYRMATTKKVGLELAEITSETDENIEDVIYSMGFTDGLFDTAYDEIFNLMKNNSWHNFRNAILEYCGDDEFRKLQKKKLEIKRVEQKQTTKMVQVINRIARSHRKYTNHMDRDSDEDEMDCNDSDEEAPPMGKLSKQTSIHDLLRKKSTSRRKVSSTKRVRHAAPPVIPVPPDTIVIVKSKVRRRSKDDLDAYGDSLALDLDEEEEDTQDYDVQELPYKARAYKPRKDIAKSMKLNMDQEPMLLALNQSRSCENNKAEEALSDLEDKLDSSMTDTCAIEENLEFTIKRDAFKARNMNMPRLSFLPTIMPSIEKSDTSPIVKVASDVYNLRNGGMAAKPSQSGMTPGGGACVVSNDIAANVSDCKDGKYSPSELFDLVSTTFPWDYSNNNNGNNSGGGTNALEMKQSNENTYSDIQLPKQNQVRLSGIYKSANGRLPLYVTHKKRKSKLAKNQRKSHKMKHSNTALNSDDISTSI